MSSVLGQGGEERTLNDLSALPDSYTAITNWRKSEDVAWDVDLLLIGPHGVLIAEIKTWTVPCGCKRDRWYRLYRNGCRKAIKSPTAQAARNARDVHKFLSASRALCKLTPVVVFNNRADLRLDSPPVPVIRRKDLKAFVENLPAQAGMDVAQVTKALLSPRQANGICSIPPLIAG